MIPCLSPSLPFFGADLQIRACPIFPIFHFQLVHSFFVFSLPVQYLPLTLAYFGGSQRQFRGFLSHLARLKPQTPDNERATLPTISRHQHHPKTQHITACGRQSLGYITDTFLFYHTTSPNILLQIQGEVLRRELINHDRR